MQPKSLMTYYIEGSIISRELEHMMLDYNADARFDRELTESLDDYTDRVMTLGTIANNRSKFHENFTA